MGKIAALRTHLSGKPLHTEKSFAEHVEIAGLIADGELKKALGVLDRHIDRTKSTYGSGAPIVAAAPERARRRGQ